MPENKVEVLYLSYDGLTDPLGQSQILPYLVGLSAKGYALTVISAEKAENFASGATRSRTLSGQWHCLAACGIHQKAAGAFHVVGPGQHVPARLRLHQRHRFSIVHCRSYLTALLGLRLKERHGLKFIFDMRGFWADERVEGGLWNLGNPLFRRIFAFLNARRRTSSATPLYHQPHPRGQADHPAAAWPGQHSHPGDSLLRGYALFKLPKKQKVRYWDG
jgi:hypothetical protein